MSHYWSDNHRTLYNGNCRSMSELPDNSIQCCVTSPPYWGLRKYAGEQDSIWGGTPDCQHEWITEKSQSIEYVQGNPEFARPHRENKSFQSQTNTCSLCGAWRGAYGLEPTPQLYVEHTVEVLREIRRVLRKDGVVFWNIDDSYAGSWGNSGSRAGGQRPKARDKFERPAYENYTERPVSSYPQGSIKPKDLCLIPFRVAIAAQEDGWWVRSVIIWNKPNPMPESVTDRPTGSHEYILMLTKSAKYYWDMEAVREKASVEYDPNHVNIKRDWSEFSPIETHQQTGNPIQNTNPQAPEAGRNLRDVWTFPTQPYPDAHFATYPEKLPELCIKAATPEVGCCSKCGMPWERIVEHKNMVINRTEWGEDAGNRTASSGTMVSPAETKTIGWQPGCNCDADKVPSTVLEPFCGSGTTLEVAAKLNRKAVGYEISEEYCKLIVERNNQSVLL